MKLSNDQFLAAIAELSPTERAAALAHRVYVMTAQREGWPLRVAEEWDQLSASEQKYNIEAVATWLEAPALLEAWAEAMGEAADADEDADED